MLLMLPQSPSLLLAVVTATPFCFVPLLLLLPSPATHQPPSVTVIFVGRNTGSPGLWFQALDWWLRSKHLRVLPSPSPARAPAGPVANRSPSLSRGSGQGKGFGVSGFGVSSEWGRWETEKGREREMSRELGEAMEPSEKSPPYLLISFSFILLQVLLF